MLSDREIKELKNKLNDYESKISKMKKDISYAEYEYRRTEGDINNFDREISSNNNSLNSYEREYKNCKSEADKLFKKAKELRRQALSNDDIRTATNYEVEAEQYLRKANSISVDISRLESSNRTINNQKFDEERKLKDLKKYLDDSEKALKKLDKERYDFRTANKI